MKFESKSFLKSKGFGLLQFRSEDADTFEYVSSNYALKNKIITVKEMNEQGSVNNLVVENNSPHFVFFMDGDVLVGAKQNRVLNTSVLLEPESITKITVSCIEQGRWKNKSKTFTNSEYSLPAKLRKMKSINIKNNLKSNKSYYANQSELWSEINAYEICHEYNSETMDLNELMMAKENNFKKFIEDFHFDKDANGLAMFSGDKLINVEIFNKSDIYKEYFSKMLYSTAMEIYHLDKSDSKMQKDDAEDIVKIELKKLDSYDSKNYPGLGVGTEKRYDTFEFSCHSLSYNENIIHFAFLNI